VTFNDPASTCCGPDGALCSPGCDPEATLELGYTEVCVSVLVEGVSDRFSKVLPSDSSSEVSLWLELRAWFVDVLGSFPEVLMKERRDNECMAGDSEIGEITHSMVV